MPFFRNPFSTPAIPAAPRPPILSLQLDNKEYELFAKIVYQYSRIELGPNKKEMVASRLLKRLKACNMTDFKTYLELLNSPKGKEELTHFIDAISTNHTFFFREIAHFDFLKNKILPALIADKTRTNQKHFRVWSSASSSGEEAYSVAILLNEFFQKHPDWQWSIEATDISTRILEIAKKAEYERIRLGSMEPQYIVKYFQKFGQGHNEYFQLSPLLKSHVNFRQLNLITSTYPFTQPFDLIFCRNVMIYFDLTTKQELLNKLTAQLRTGGYLYTGHSESLTGLKYQLKNCQVSIFQKTDTN